MKGLDGTDVFAVNMEYLKAAFGVIVFELLEIILALPIEGGRDDEDNELNCCY